MPRSVQPLAAEHSAGSFLGTPATAPGPKGPQMLGDLREIRRNPLAYLDHAWRTYGDVVQFPIPRPPSYLVNDPLGVQRVLVTNGRNYGKSTIQYRSLSLVTGEGLLVADTDAWRHQRPLVQPAFHRQTLERIVGHVHVALERMFAQWGRAGSVVDVDASMMHAALEVVGHSLFGTDLSADAQRLSRATLSALEVVIARARVPVSPPSWMPTPMNIRLNHAVRELDDSVATMMQARSTVTQSDDMLGLLMASRDERGDGLSVEEIRNQVVTFIVAGHETVASAMTWAWALLASHPQAMQSLQTEADEVLGGRMPSFADFARLPFARAVLDEALRLYPPAWLLTRKSREADELGGREIPSGALVIMSPWLLHRHPDLWTSPNDFRPDRFLTGEVDRNAFIPFGNGLRLCIGRDFAYLEGVLMLAAIAGRYALSLPGGMPAFEALVTMRPVGGLPMIVQPRVM